jgi:hypothetical protein
VLWHAPLELQRRNRFTARAGNRRFELLRALRAHTKVPYKIDLLWRTLRPLKRPRRPGRRVEEPAFFPVHDPQVSMPVAVVKRHTRACGPDGYRFGKFEKVWIQLVHLGVHQAECLLHAVCTLDRVQHVAQLQLLRSVRRGEAVHEGEGAAVPSHEP